MEKNYRYLAQSPYNYVHGNPLYYVDPNGKQTTVNTGILNLMMTRDNVLALSGDEEAQKRVVTRTKAVDFAARTVVEPYDWLRIGGDWLTGNGSGWDAAAMLPFLSGGTDDVARGLLKARRAIGMSSEGAQFALENVGRVDHASRHLIDVGVMKGVRSGQKEARSMFRELASGILENPSATFDHTVRGGLEAKGFLGTVDGEQVVVLVAKEAKGKIRQGDVVTSFVPSHKQLDDWLNQ